MALAVSLRRALFVLFTMTILILTVLYWNEGSIKTPTLMNTASGRSVNKRSSINSVPLPTEHLWTYKCEGDKCVRYHYHHHHHHSGASAAGAAAGAAAAGSTSSKMAEKRVPFTTCAMTCGEINIWPHPTIKTAVSSKSIKFSVDDVRLHLDSPYRAVRDLFEAAFELFVRDLHVIQRLEESDRSAGLETPFNGFSDGDGDAKAEREPLTDDEVTRQQQQQQQQHHHHQQHHNHHQGSDAAADMDNPLHRMNAVVAKAFLGNDLAAASNGGGGGHGRAHSSVDVFMVNVMIHKFADVDLNFETDESYHLITAFEKRKMTANITANSFFGARHALSTLQQLIWFDDEDNLLRTLTRAIIVDAPKFRYRGLMLDTSRHFFSVEAIKRTIAGMSHAKLNRFHWHITDSQSFPYISKYYPQLATHGAYSDLETYSPRDVREITAFGRMHGVQVLPEIDAPAHAGNGWDWGPRHGLGELSLCINQQPWSFYCGEPPCGQLNPKNNNTYLVLQRLYEEMLNLTGPTDFFHLGGDEVNLECWAQYFNDTDLRGLWCDFTKLALTRLKVANNNALPKYVAVWSSPLTNTRCLANSQFAVQIWGGSTWQENYDLIDNGYNVIFSHVDAWYLDCGFGNWRSVGEGACSPYRTWQNVYKHRPWDRMRLNKSQKKQVLGGEVCLWTEQVDESQLDNRLWPRSAALGERLWSDPNDEAENLPPEVFKRMSVFRNRLVELGFKAEPIFPKYCAQNPGECI